MAIRFFTAAAPVFTAAALALMVGTGIFGVATSAAQAQTAAPTASAPTSAHAPRPSRIEGRIAFLRTEFKITDAQAPQWTAFADALRQNDQAMRTRFQQMRQAHGKPANVVEQLERQQSFAEARVDATKRLLAAYRPLDAVLTAEQKQTADELMGHHGGGHRHHHP